MAISSPGIGSNLDVNSIVTQLMTIEQRPLLLLAQKESTYQARLSSLGTIKGALSSLQSAAGALKSVNTTSFSATSSDTSAVAASASSTAVAGTYAVSVTQLAQAQRLVAAGQASATVAIGGGTDTTLNFSFGTISGGTFNPGNGTYAGASFTVNADKPPFSVTIDATNNTLEGIRDAVNAANGGVTASIVNDGSGTPYRLSFSVQDMGAAKSLKVEVTGEAALGALLANDPAGTQQLAETVTAKNAALTVDGTAVTSATNAVAGAIPGVTLALAKTTTSPVTITVARSFSSASNAVAALVKAYNDYNAVNATATAKGAIFQGDGSVLSVQQRLRAALGIDYGTSGAYRSLSALGVGFQRDGRLVFDSGRLSAGLASDPAGALETIAAAGNAVKSVTDAALGSQGVIQSSTNGINRSLTAIDSRREAIERRLETTEKRLRAQFSALDSLLSRMSQTSAFLTQQLANLPTIGSQNSN